jgi:threonyl-tRNA synthetase
MFFCASKALQANDCIRRIPAVKIIYNDGHVADCPEEMELEVLRHSAAHIMAQAIKRLYPQADFAYGPATQNGFYYDVDLGEQKLEPEDLEAIEKEMRKIVKENLPFKSYILPRDEALKLMEERGEKYKIEHIGDLADETEFSFFQQGEYVDMCLGPHLCYTKALKAFKITQQSGAYWKNDSENKMLTRINGVAFRSAEELAEWEKQQAEARERDHRKIGKEMQLFMTDDLVGRGLPMFLPNGYVVWQELENYIKAKERKLGYQHVMTPCVGTVDLYKTSGHWDHYKDNMFPAMEMEGEAYVLRPMNCPHHMRIYANRPRSYRNLPLRIGEIAHDFRYESSGTLKGIERGRHFCQNDAHLFVTPDQIKDEVATVCDLIFEVYRDFNITDYRCVLSLRDPADKKKYHDDDQMWETAETALREVLTELGINFTEEIGEAAFYGPKLDVNVKPAVGAEYTLSTCQLDFCLPARFQLTYIDSDGTEKTPVVLHRAILGSLDRFMAYLIEETKGKFPAWLAPVQVKVLPVSEKTMDYARAVADKLDDAGLRVVLDTSNEKIGYKIRQAQSEDRVPYMLVLGPKEAESGTVAVRSRSGDEGAMALDAFIARIRDEIDTKKM